MQQRKSPCLILGVFFLFALFSGCGNEEDVVISCKDLEPCVNIGCNSCGWPTGSCSIPDGSLVAATVSDAGRAPFFILLRIETLSDTQGSETPCENGELVIANEEGELLRRTLALDEPVNICTTSPISGAHAVSLSCNAFPTRARYQVSIADSNGTGMWP